MEKKYKINKPESQSVEEPPMEQHYRGKKISPPLTEEELKNALTTEDVQARIFKHIDKLFGE